MWKYIGSRYHVAGNNLPCSLAGVPGKHEKIHSSAGISSVSNLNNIDNTQLIIDGVNDPIVAFTDTLKVWPAREHFRP